MQRRCKHVFSTIDRLCFLRSPCRGVIKRQRMSSELVEFETPACQDGSLGAEEMNLVEYSALVVVE
jgi:hypothetical protein